MATLKVVSHIPAINATGIYRNAPIYVTFDKKIAPASYTWETIAVNEDSTYSSIAGDLSVVWHASGYVKQVAFTPTLNLDSNNTYSVYVFGAPNGILGYSGEELAETYTWSFTTGTGILDSTPSSGVPTGVVPSATPTVLSGIPLDEQDDIATFAVYTSDPLNQEPNVITQTDKMKVYFTGTISTSVEDISGYVSMTEEDVL